MKKKLLIACLAGLLFMPNAAIAAPFPDKTDAVVQDEGNYMKKEDRQKLTDAIGQYPNHYKVVVVESTTPEAPTADEYAHKLYDKYNLTDDSMVIVLGMNTEEVGVYAGLALQKKGAKPELLHDKLTSYYVPYRNQKEYMKGIELFIKEVNAEMSRLASKPASQENSKASNETSPASKSNSIWGGFPWWLYGLAILIVASIIGMIVVMIRRRKIFSEVDDVEDWKDELVEKIQTIEVEKSMRKATGMTEERYAMLANRKENMLRVRIPEIEMIILEAEDACERFRFQSARSLLSEGQEILTDIENELQELKEDTTKVVQSKKESKQVIPEIVKLFETVERKLTNYRLDYGLSFHELKEHLDEVEKLRSEVKTALAAGDAVQAFDKTTEAQNVLEELTASLDQIPPLITLVHKDLKEELKQLEKNISAAVGDGYDLNQSSLDTGLLQARQLHQLATTALEEGNLSLVQTHAKAFEVQVDHIYHLMEESVLQAQKQVACASEIVSNQENEPHDETAVESGNEEVEVQPDEPATENLPEAEIEAQGHQQDELEGMDEPLRDNAKQEELPTEMSAAERHILLNKPVEEIAAHEPAVSGHTEEVEYELVIPKQADVPEELVCDHAQEDEEEILIDSEDDALDEIERISGTLVRIRQQIKRSYLPGVPDELKLLFEQVVQTLGRVKLIMDSHNYSLDEVAYLLSEANDALAHTQKMATHTISTCQLAEGAIQYTNRYRRQNRQVNELLTRAEASFRQLRFSEALHLAEEARLVIEGEPETSVSVNRWLLRRKNKENQRK
ncbi:septation ring formation regulator EzrA [Brevibacillus ginsengisoli]|uniref:septation ring formation regulator EzrA n=1 Tax=Brevibacillus ginsengisoli TaxID=363854 RepID=UPI003CEACC3A